MCARCSINTRRSSKPHWWMISAIAARAFCSRPCCLRALPRAEARRVLVAGGLLAFTVETHRGEGVILGEGLRYAHGAGYVRASVEACGLALSRCEDLSARHEDNAPVPGLVVVATRT